MAAPHGEADRLILQRPEDLNLQALDDQLRNQPPAPTPEAGAEAERLVAGNDFLGPQRFGRMFPDTGALEPFRPPDTALIELGQAMRETLPEGPELNSTLPAGFTYLGQFIDHDITFDPTVGFPEIDDPEAMAQGRTPTLDLDSLYGLGPTRQGELYDPAHPASSARFRIGVTSPVPTPLDRDGTHLAPVELPNDLPRCTDKSPAIGDHRNDENLIVAQLHLTFLKLHNKLVASLTPAATAAATPNDQPHPTEAFQQARRLVRWHYQWIVLNDFLPRILDPEVLEDIRTGGRRFYDFSGPPWGGHPFMPIEFSVAAYRFGHSLVREVYSFNRAFTPGSPTALAPASLELLFAFTGTGGFPLTGATVPPGAQATHPTLPSNWIIDWRRFFEVDDVPGDTGRRNLARRIDSRLIPQLHELPLCFQPEALTSLAVRNLLRGSRLGLPTGQGVAHHIGVEVLPPEKITEGGPGQINEILRRHEFDRHTPLWFYILKEAELRADNHLGAVGSRIVGEVFWGLLEGDPQSWMHQQPDWTPELPGATPGQFTMADLLSFVDDVNPLG